MYALPEQVTNQTPLTFEVDAAVLVKCGDDNWDDPTQALHDLFSPVLIHLWLSAGTLDAAVSDEFFFPHFAIEIAPKWNGGTQSPNSVVTIRSTSAGFQRSWDSVALAPENNVLRISAGPSDAMTEQPSTPASTPALSQDAIAPSEVSALVKAVGSPALLKPELANLGISSAWLAERAANAARTVGSLGEPNDTRQQEFFRRSFTDITMIGTMLPRIVGTSWTDDPVWVRVKIQFADGKTWTAETRNQASFMLPWTVQRNGESFKTFNADIPRAVATLLPKGAVNREGIAGAGLDNSIVRAIEPTIKRQWQQIGAEDQAGRALTVLRQNYAIRRSEVSDHISLSFGPDSYDSSNKQTNLQADVGRQSFPTNLVVATVFPIENGHAVGLDSFLRSGDKYEQIVLLNPWLMASLNKHRDLGAWHMFVKDASMSDKAMRIFSSDMHDLGRDDLAREVSQHRSDVALLNYYGSYMILFPDHHAVIWRWGKYRDLFSWPAATLKTERCERYPTVTEGCVAAQIDSSGHLLK